MTCVAGWVAASLPVTNCNIVLSHFSLICSYDATKHIISRPAIVSSRCPSVLNMSGLSPRHSKPLISQWHFQFSLSRISVFVYDFVVLPYSVFPEGFILPSVCEASGAEPGG